jgi:hypothetical protein
VICTACASPTLRRTASAPAATAAAPQHSCSRGDAPKVLRRLSAHVQHGAQARGASPAHATRWPPAGRVDSGSSHRHCLSLALLPAWWFVSLWCVLAGLTGWQCAWLFCPALRSSSRLYVMVGGVASSAVASCVVVVAAWVWRWLGVGVCVVWFVGA